MESNTYYLFAWGTYEALGGLNDIVGVYSSLVEADKAFIDCVLRQGLFDQTIFDDISCGPTYNKSLDRGEIFRCETRKIVRAWTLSSPEQVRDPVWELETRLIIPDDIYSRKWYKTDRVAVRRELIRDKR